jgi:hypothetical protein
MIPVLSTNTIPANALDTTITLKRVVKQRAAILFVTITIMCRAADVLDSRILPTLDEGRAAGTAERLETLR